jgi:hypothetical protein
MGHFKLILFLALTLLAGCGESNRERQEKAVGRVIAADRKLALSVKDQSGMGSTKLTGYVVALRNIDFSNCPEDFTQAYRCHIDAWDNYAKWLHDNEGATYLWKRLFTTRASTIENEDIRQQGEVKRTWKEVQRISRSYGIEVED